jgi:uncharacterized protein
VPDADVRADARVRKVSERSRYELVLADELIGTADYRVEGDEVIFPHTEIVAPYRGLGYAEMLVQAAMDDVREQGRTVIPRCWYVMDFLETHPEYRDVLAA